MNMTGAATSNLNGSALAVNTSTEGCSDTGMYAKIKEIRYSGNWYDSLKYMAVDGAEISLAQGNTTTLKVIGVYNDGTTGIIRNSNLSFTSGSSAIATVDTDGVVTAEGAGTTQIHITVTSKPDVDAYANITVAN